jgi:tetratricopeptide (TPR) repeat protein
LSLGNFQQAIQAFQKADEEAKKRGRRNIDSLLIGQAFAYYKLNQKEKAIQYLHAANQINPYRLSVQRYLSIWQR